MAVSTPSREAIIHASDVHAWYGSSHVLHGVDPVSYTHLTLPTILRV